jgi:hypothetical protein
MVENADPPRVRVAAARSGTEPVERSQNAVENRWVSMRELFTGTRSRNDGGALDRLPWGPGATTLDAHSPAISIVIAVALTLDVGSSRAG